MCGSCLPHMISLLGANKYVNVFPHSEKGRREEVSHRATLNSREPYRQEDGGVLSSTHSLCGFFWGSLRHALVRRNIIALDPWYMSVSEGMCVRGSSSSPSPPPSERIVYEIPLGPKSQLICLFYGVPNHLPVIWRGERRG